MEYVYCVMNLGELTGVFGTQKKADTQMEHLIESLAMAANDYAEGRRLAQNLYYIRKERVH